MKIITSPQNEHFTLLKALHDSRGIRKQKRFLVSGEKVVRETLKHHASQVAGLVLDSAHLDHDYGDLPAIALDHPLFRELDQFGCHTPLLICHQPEVPNWDPKPQGLDVLLTQGDPANLGAAVRTAQAFGADRIVLLKEAALPFHPKALRAASSANLAVPFVGGPSVRELPPSPSTRVALDLQGLPLPEFKWPRDVQLLVGEEGPGLPPGVDAVHVSIQIANRVESLNATIATGLALYSYRVQYPFDSKFS